MAGLHAPSPGNSNCSACEPGRYSGTRAARLAAPAAALAMLPFAESPSTCTACPAGKFSLGNTSLCTDCRPGFAQPLVGQSACDAVRHVALPTTRPGAQRSVWRAVQWRALLEGPRGRAVRELPARLVPGQGRPKLWLMLMRRLAAQTRSRTAPWSQDDCAVCPDNALCVRNAAPSARRDVFLLRSDAGTLASYKCPSGLCLSSEACQSAPTSPGANTTVVLSCCAPDRLPATDADGNANLLCARCAPPLKNVSAGHALARVACLSLCRRSDRDVCNATPQTSAPSWA
jgi:hypothetical protein